MSRPPAGNHHLAGAAMVLVAATFWGSLGLFAKALYARGFTPMELASVRAAVALVGLALWMAPRARQLAVPLRSLPFFAAYGIVGFALFEILYFETIRRTTVGVAVALLYTAPAFVLILARVLDREAIRARRVAALIGVLMGVLLVTGALETVRAGAGPVTGAAIAFGLGSAFTYALYTAFGKRAMRDHGPAVALFWVLVFSTVALAFLEPPWIPLGRDASALPLLIGIGIIPTLLAYLLYLNALRHLSAPTAAMLATLEPVVAAVLGVLVLGERLSPLQSIGIVVIVMAAALLAARDR